MKTPKISLFFLLLIILNLITLGVVCASLYTVQIYMSMSVVEQPIQKFEVLRSGVLWVSESWVIQTDHSESITNIEVNYITSSGVGNSLLKYVKTNYSPNFPNILKTNIRLKIWVIENWVEWVEGEELSLVEGSPNPQYYLKMSIIGSGNIGEPYTFTLRFYSDNHTQEVQHTITIIS